MAKKLEEPNQRFTLFAKETSIEKLDSIARKESFKQDKAITRTDLVNEALEAFIEKWERKNGEILLSKK